MGGRAAHSIQNHLVEGDERMTVEISTPHAKHLVLEEKLTSLGLYVTAQEAYEMWKADPERIKVLDVRTFEEYVLIGHAEMAANVPLAFPTYNWDANKGNYSVVGNKDFITHATQRFKPEDTILVMCRSGGRSAMAVNALAKAGFTQVHNIIDGFEGDKVDDPESIYHGMRLRNGWKNSAPWTYRLDPKLVWLPSEAELETLRKTLDL
jgi:rhodanese-related sulfurtransferase